MNKRMKALCGEINIPEGSIYTIDTEKILDGVNKKLHTESEGMIIPMRGKLISALPIAAALVLIMATLAMAFGGSDFVVKIFRNIMEDPTERYMEYATEEVTEEEVIVPEVVTEEPTEVVTEEETKAVNPNYESPIFDKYLKEDAEEAEEYMQHVLESVEDENYILTLNEVLGDESNVYLTVTIEAKTEEGKASLMSGGYYWLRIEAYSDTYGWINAGGGTSEIQNMKRENSRSFSVHCFGSDLVEGGYKEMRITCRAFSTEIMDDRYIYFEIESKEEKIEFELLGQAFTGGYIYLTPMSIEIAVTRDATEEYAPDARNLNTFFKFKDGSIKTFNQVAGFDGSMSRMDGAEPLYKYQTGTKNILDLDSIESIIVKDIEYPVDDPASYQIASVPERLKPFTVSETGYRATDGTYYLCTLKELTDRLGAVYTYEADGVIEYELHGKTYRVEAENSAVSVNGENVYFLYTPPALNENGEIVVGLEFVYYVIGARQDEIAGTGVTLIVP